MAKVTVHQSDSATIRNAAPLTHIALVGLIAGALTYVLWIGIGRYIIDPLMCRTDGIGSCADASMTAGNVALIIAAVAALFGFIRLGVARPLLIVLASAISLWGVSSLLEAFAWYEALGWYAGVFVVSYVVYAWFSRPKSIILALVLSALIVILSRLILFS